jgi:hypothetical protein
MIRSRSLIWAGASTMPWDSTSMISLLSAV